MRVLEEIAADRAALVELDAATGRQLMILAGKVSRPQRDEQRRLKRAFRKRDRVEMRARDGALVARTVNRATRRSSAFVLPASTAAQTEASQRSPVQLEAPRNCYVCKTGFVDLHHFYDSLCPSCAALNWEKRHQTGNLSGRIALVTGARIKIGYQIALMLLRAGARVIGTTRFAVDAAERYAREADFEHWRGRLTLHAVDLRHIPSVERLSMELSNTLPALDFLINNAAQTVRRPQAFYRTLMEREARLSKLPALRALIRSPGGAMILSESSAAELAFFPPGGVDLDGQQADFRPDNSWRLTADRVSTEELVEVHLINSIAPFLLTSRLRGLLAKRGDRCQHVVQVSAMEAQFARNKKTDKHPHTNMAKAALNMLTRTSAVDYQQDGIFMNSVDTGWITDEDPLQHVARKQVVHDFHPPLDAVDGAARVLDPIFVGFSSGDHPWGHFFKDYKSIAW